MVVLDLDIRKNKLYKSLDCWFGDILNFDILEKGLELVSSPHFLYSRNLEIKGTLSAMFFIKNVLRLLCNVANVVYLYGLRMSIVKHFSKSSIKYEFGNSWKVEFWWFPMINDIWNISNMYETCEIRANIPRGFLIWHICKPSTLHL